VYWTLPLARANVGVKVTVFASDERVNVPGTAALLPVTVSMNELVFSDTEFIGLLNCMTIDEFAATKVAPFAGVMLTTDGFGNIAAAPVVKVSVTAVLMVFPARSATPLIDMVKVVPGVKRLVVFNLSTWLALESAGEVTTVEPFAFRVTPLRLLAATGRSNST